MAFLLAQPLQRGGVEVVVKAHDGFAGRGLLVAGTVELVGRDLCNGCELNVELKAALEQHFVAHGLRIVCVEQAGLFVGNEGFERGELVRFGGVGVGREVGAGEGSLLQREDLEAHVDGLWVVAVALDDALDALDGDVADFFEACFVSFTVLVCGFGDLHTDKFRA